MTKYILAGGNDRGVAAYPDLLKKELPHDLSEKSLLSCFFSLKQERWAAKSQDWQQWFLQNFGIHRYEVADPNDFEVQLRRADIVYFHGGSTQLLLDSLSKYKDLKQKLKNKIVIGSSAGANVLSDNFWSSTFKKPGKGLAIVEVNIMVHYGAEETNGVIRTEQDWIKEENDFLRSKQLTGVLHLPEGTLKVFDET